MTQRLARLRHWRRIFAWALWISLLTLAVSVVRAMGFTKASSAVQMDTTVLVGAGALVMVLLAIAGLVVTSVAVRRAS